METITLNVINRNLKHMMEEIVYIKEHMVDIDSIMTAEDKIALKEARKELKENKTITLDEFEKQLGL